MRHLIDIKDLTVGEIDELIECAEDIIANPKKYSEVCHGKKLATLFFEPSTRTRLSFEAAMWELGGSVLGFSSAETSSASKGESVADTTRVVGCYADIIAMRHPKEGAPLAAAMKSYIPIINAGDGGHNHPTQTLTDLLTIALFTALPLSSNIARTRPMVVPDKMLSPVRSVPVCTMMLATGPLPLSSFASIIVPFA